MKRPSSILALFVGVLAVSSARAQQVSRAPLRLQTQGPPVAVHLDLDSGALTLPGSAELATSNPVLCFDNSVDDDGFADALLYPAGDELYDWGIKTCAISGRVERLTIGYGSQAVPTHLGGPGGALTVRVFEHGQGFGVRGRLVFELSMTGLPSGGPSPAVAPYYLTVDLGSNAFLLEDGPIGWSFENPDGATAPLLVDVGREHGTQNFYDVYRVSPTQDPYYSGSFSLGPGGASNDPWENSFYLQLWEDGSVAPAGTKANGLAPIVDPRTSGVRSRSRR